MYETGVHLLIYYLKKVLLILPIGINVSLFAYDKIMFKTLTVNKRRQDIDKNVRTPPVKDGVHKTAQLELDSPADR